MASHPPAPLEKPVSIGSGRKETRDTWLAFGESLLLNIDPVDYLVIRSAFLYVQCSLMGVILVYGPESVYFFF